MRGRTVRRRLGYTLVELVVVMTVITALGLLLLLVWRGFGSSTDCQHNADALAAMLLSAKTRAVRDGRPTGVRLASGQLVLIQQPDDFAGGALRTVAGKQLSFADTDFTSGHVSAADWMVQPGDRILLHGGGSPHLVVGVTAGSLTIADDLVTAEPILDDQGTVVGSVTHSPTEDVVRDAKGNVTRAQQHFVSEWRVIRQPRLLAGEMPVPLTAKVDLSKSVNFSGDLVFLPSGVPQHGAAFVWLESAGGACIVGAQGTGFIGEWDATGSDPWSAVRDPHASGM